MTLPGHRARLTLAALAALLLAAGCGSDLEDSPIKVGVGDRKAPRNVLGFPVLATKNTTRVAGEDPVEDAAGVASAVYPAVGERQRPQAVVLVDKGDWAAGVAASALAAPPLRAPILLTDGDEVPDVTKSALDALRPRGSPEAGRAQAIRVGGAAKPEGLKTQSVGGASPFELADALDSLRTSLTGSPSRDVLVVSADDPRFAMPAAAWAAKSGDSVLFTSRDSVPAPTRRALERHERANIHVLGPERLISAKALDELRRLGTVTRIGGRTPAQNAIAFARFSDGRFGWGIQDPGHGLVIANSNRPLDAAAAAPLSASGTYGPLLLVDSDEELPPELHDYLLDIEPGFRSDPVRGVYNHAWLIGDESAIGVAAQTEIDELTEIVRVKQRSQ